MGTGCGHRGVSLWGARGQLVDGWPTGTPAHAGLGCGQRKVGPEQMASGATGPESSRTTSGRPGQAIARAATVRDRRVRVGGRAQTMCPTTGGRPLQASCSAHTRCGCQTETRGLARTSVGPPADVGPGYVLACPARVCEGRFRLSPALRAKPPRHPDACAMDNRLRVLSENPYVCAY